MISIITLATALAVGFELGYARRYLENTSTAVNMCWKPYFGDNAGNISNSRISSGPKTNSGQFVNSVSQSDSCEVLTNLVLLIKQHFLDDDDPKILSKSKNKLLTNAKYLELYSPPLPKCQFPFIPICFFKIRK